ncbi:MAG: threonylcarbamoyl-AMP synthase [Cryobacterium sp.]|nr:threonylcarbamoyl-AMP synthase [Cryobacterium sp.]MCO5293672.1 L-threonylcarbamoyladenylate synthase [Homoserinimonas sp.]MCW5944870.1 threonylcarbamoyl-AMP synthase [Cryobacterium sp.]
MATIYDCADSAELLTGMRLARQAIGMGELVVIPTDTVYGLGCDAFNPRAVNELLAAKGRGRQSPPPVLIPGIPTLDALADSIPDEARRLVKAFWPGALTLIVPARDSLQWDLGDTHGTVALRMPNDEIALELLSEVGPMAVSSANLTGQPAASTAQEAFEALGDKVKVYLDGGVRKPDPDSKADPGSTIIDLTGLLIGKELQIVRHGAISDEDILEALK